MSEIEVFKGADGDDRRRLYDAISKAYESAGLASPAGSKRPSMTTVANLREARIPDIPEFSDLIGIDPSVYRQINAALRGGKQHLMFYGPPGTGKTSLARKVAGVLHESWRMITGSADWTSQDVIGGYQPVGQGEIAFVPGVLLQNFDRPLIIDELNRCDIDKVIGPLFTVLSGHETTLPYRIDVSEADSPMYVILPAPKSGTSANEFAPSSDWRLIATINTIDKAALYQMSFALSRRFAWIFVDVPKDTAAFITTLLSQRMPGIEMPESPDVPLARVWSAVNRIRPVGPAPTIDAIAALATLRPGMSLVEAPREDDRDAYLDAFYLYFFPLLDGISGAEASALTDSIGSTLGLAPDDPRLLALKERMRDISL